MYINEIVLEILITDILILTSKNKNKKQSKLQKLIKPNKATSAKLKKHNKNNFYKSVNILNNQKWKLA